MPKGSRERSDPIRDAIFSEDDDDFIDFVEVSSTRELRQPQAFVFFSIFLYVFERACLDAAFALIL